MIYKEAIIFKIFIYGLMWVLHFSLAEGVTSRIIGGYRAPQEFGRFHTSLQNITGHHVCGGAVVSRRHLLTAAHCVSRVKPQYIKVVVGTTDLDKGGKKYSVKHIHIYKEYNATQRTNDIAIINIKGLFNLKYVDILKLPRTQLRDGDKVIISGFGAQEANGISSRHMYALNLTVFCQKTCRYAMRYSREVTNRMFCTFTRIGQGTCHGDSGGPLIQGKTIVGIVSWGIPCAVGFPDVHTRIFPYVDWIRANIQKKRSETFSAIQVKTKIEISLSKKNLINKPVSVNARKK